MNRRKNLSNNQLTRSRQFGTAIVALSSLVTGLTALSGVIGTAAAATKPPKAGSTCKKAQLGAVSANVVCTKVGKSFRWTAVAANPSSPATSAPTTGAIASAPGSANTGGLDFVASLNNAIKPAGLTFEATGPCQPTTGDCSGILMRGADRAEITIAGMSQPQWELNQTLGLTKSQKPGPVLYANTGNGQLFLPMSNPRAVYPVYALIINGFGLSIPDGLNQMADIIRPIAPVLESVSRG